MQATKRGHPGFGTSTLVGTQTAEQSKSATGQGSFCLKCGAWRGQLGLEPTIELYVKHIVAIFREVRRVLRDDGTLWLNMGDCYSGSGRGDATKDNKGQIGREGFAPDVPSGLKPKDLVGLPWRVAFALQADGWVLRSDIVWSKPNPMPESVTDRPTKAHEMIFLFAKAKWTGHEESEIEKRISDEDARWLALFLDTEGNIVVKRVETGGRRWYGIQIAFANTNRELLERTNAMIGCGTILQRKGANAPMFYLQLSNRQARDLLRALYPYLIVKPRQARLAIYVQDMLSTTGKKRPGGFREEKWSEQLETAWVSMKSLNHFGNPDLSWVPQPKHGRWSTANYFFDADAVREPNHESSIERAKHHLSNPIDNPDYSGKQFQDYKKYPLLERMNPSGRNIRTVWTIPTAPYPEAHFATFPPKLVEPCIRAGTSEKGCCATCGAPWERVMGGKIDERGKNPLRTPKHEQEESMGLEGEVRIGSKFGGSPGWRKLPYAAAKTIGFRPTCDHYGTPTLPEYPEEPDGYDKRALARDSWEDTQQGFLTGAQRAKPKPPILPEDEIHERECERISRERIELLTAWEPYPANPCIVLDPFAGSGTVGQVARGLGRSAILIEIKEEYATLIRKRVDMTLKALENFP